MACRETENLRAEINNIRAELTQTVNHTLSSMSLVVSQETEKAQAEIKQIKAKITQIVNAAMYEVARNASSNIQSSVLALQQQAEYDREALGWVNALRNYKGRFCVVSDCVKSCPPGFSVFQHEAPLPGGFWVCCNR